MKNKKLRIKKCSILLAAVLALVLRAPAFAQELKLSGEAKTGVYWEQVQNEGAAPAAKVDIQSKNDDAGSGHGRFRLNLNYDNGNNFGMRMRLNWENWSFSNTNAPPEWTYAFGYGNFFEDQLTVSVGKLGASPWGTGGPEMWKELETGGAGGIRTEYKPSFVPGQLNVGFVLNYFNQDRDFGWPEGKPLSLLNILGESIIGASYTHDLFLARVAYRFDDEYDSTQENKGRENKGKGEDEFVYRVEERVLKNFLPGFQVWAIGYIFGLTAPLPEMQLFRNWIFVQYAPEQFTAQLRFGLDYITKRGEFLIKPSFYYNLFDKLLTAGVAFTYCQDFGDGKVYKDSPYLYLEFEPKIQINFQSSYIAFVYNFNQAYKQRWEGLRPDKDPLSQTQWMNLRFCIYF